MLIPHFYEADQQQLPFSAPRRCRLTLHYPGFKYSTPYCSCSLCIVPVQVLFRVVIHMWCSPRFFVRPTVWTPTIEYSRCWAMTYGG